MIVYLHVSLADSHIKHKILPFEVIILFLRLVLLGLPGFELLLELFIFIVEPTNPMLLLTRLTFKIVLNFPKIADPCIEIIE
jgi:hypothetical protein